MKELLEYTVKAIVQYPDEVKIESSQEGGVLVFTLHVHADDKKIVIGKQGRTINSLRNLLRIKAVKEGERVNLELAE